MSQRGCQGRAELVFKRHGPRTILHRNYTTLPAQVVRPFYAEGSGRAYLYLLTPMGGMLGGDRLEIHIELGPDAQVCLTTASATKVHPSAEAPAEQVLSIDLGPRSCLEFLPEPTILFRGARWRQQTVIRRAADSRLLWLEPWSAGRVAQQEVFQFACLDTRLEVWTEGRLSLFDRMRICPPTYPAQALGLWEGRPHVLTLYLLQNSHPGCAWMQAIRNQLSDGPVLVGLSYLATPGMMARVLSAESEALTRVAQTLWQHIRESLWAEDWHPWRKL